MAAESLLVQINKEIEGARTLLEAAKGRKRRYATGMALRNYERTIEAVEEKERQGQAISVQEKEKYNYAKKAIESIMGKDDDGGGKVILHQGKLSFNNLSQSSDEMVRQGEERHNLEVKEKEELVRKKIKESAERLITEVSCSSRDLGAFLGQYCASLTFSETARIIEAAMTKGCDRGTELRLLASYQSAQERCIESIHDAKTIDSLNRIKEDINGALGHSHFLSTSSKNQRSLIGRVFSNFPKLFSLLAEKFEFFAKVRKSLTEGEERKHAIQQKQEAYMGRLLSQLDGIKKADSTPREKQPENQQVVNGTASAQSAVRKYPLIMLSGEGKKVSDRKGTPSESRVNFIESRIKELQEKKQPSRDSNKRRVSETENGIVFSRGKVFGLTEERLEEVRKKPKNETQAPKI